MISPLICCFMMSTASLPLVGGPQPATVTPTTGPTEYNDDFDLTELSLEALMDIEVTIATRTAEPMSSVPAAVYVLTGDEIRRAGHSSIPEALRMVPGMHVSRWTTGDWDVTARGFGTGLAFTNSAYLNQLLVMIDGVVVYSPLFAGMFWSLQDVVMEDIDRIEIVRGPGGILWGSNAVHGVVHIITKKASETEGVQLAVRTGTDDHHGSWRYGGKFGEDSSFRVWVKGAKYDTLSNPFLGFDYDYHLASAGGRMDWKSNGKSFAFWVRAYKGEFAELGYDLTTFAPIQVQDQRDGAQVYASMTDDETGGRWQAWYTKDEQDLPTLGDINIDVYDLEYQHPIELWSNNSMNIGAGYRRTQSRLYGDDPFWYDFEPHKVNQDVFRVFAVDTISFDSIQSTLTLGLAAEHNEFTDFEVQPTLRYTWTPEGNFMLWAGVSRAVRTPSLEERTLSPDSYLAGNPNFKSESMLAYELGTRVMPTEWMAADLALFFNQYDDLHYVAPDPAFLWGNQMTNGAEGEAYGAELALDFQVTPNWKLRTAYTFEHGDFTAKDGTQLNTGNYSPAHTYNVRSYYNLTKEWELDAGVYGVEGLGGGLQAADYTRLDARIGWNPGEHYKVYLGIQDAINPTRSELDEYDNIRRAVYFGVTFSN